MSNTKETKVTIEFKTKLIEEFKKLYKIQDELNKKEKEVLKEKSKIQQSEGKQLTEEGERKLEKLQESYEKNRKVLERLEANNKEQENAIKKLYENYRNNNTNEIKNIFEEFEKNSNALKSLQPKPTEKKEEKKGDKAENQCCCQTGGNTEKKEEKKELTGKEKIADLNNKIEQTTTKIDQLIIKENQRPSSSDKEAKNPGLIEAEQEKAELEKEQAKAIQEEKVAMQAAALKQLDELSKEYLSVGLKDHKAGSMARIKLEQEHYETLREEKRQFGVFTEEEDNKLVELEKQKREKIKATADEYTGYAMDLNNLMAESGKLLSARQGKDAEETAKIQRRAAAREKAIKMFSVVTGTAASIINASNTIPFFPAGLIMAAKATALGIQQIRAISSAPLPKAARGGLIGGKPHSLGGTLIEAEAGEAVINKRSTSMFAPILSAINESGGGVPFAAPLSDGGFAHRDYQRRNQAGLSETQMEDVMTRAMAKQQIYVAIEDINKGQKQYAQTTDISTF